MLTSRIVGRQLLHYPQLPSTNDEARRLATGGAVEGTVVIAETQTAGRGRRRRRWLDTPGRSLLFSIILRPSGSRQLLPVLSLGTAAAASQALSDLYHLPVATKWPNDLLIGGGKVGGILLEASERFVVVGVGLNISGEAQELQIKVSQRITIIEEECQHSLPREEVLAALLAKIDVMYYQFQAGDVDTIIAAYKERDCVVGHNVTVRAGAEEIRGQAVDIGPAGALIIQTATGLREITAGEIHLLSNGHENFDTKP